MPVNKFNPILIVLEGSEGAGKTLTARAIKEALEKEGYEVVLSREPGGVPVSEKIRNIVVNDEMHPITEAYLYLASRAEHVQKVIKPALYDGKIVILDRFMHSTLAYQGGGRGLDINELRKLHDLALDGVKPDMVLFLDVPVDIGLARKQDDEIAKFEREKISFHNKLHAMYQSFARNGEMISIDATQSPDDVLNEALLYIKNLLD
jgi:dTMP kinase